MSFSSEVKQELCRVPLSRKCCAQAECYGVLLYCNTFSPREIRVITESDPFAQRLPQLLRRAFRFSFDRLPDGEGKHIFAVEDPRKLSAVQQLLRDVHDNLYAMAEKNLEDNTFDLTTWEEVRDMAQGRGGFARTKWCGSLECELAMKEKAGVSSRCMPLKQSGTVGKCPVCGKECTTDIYWGVAY